jgi:hypothetical protein
LSFTLIRHYNYYLRIFSLKIPIQNVVCTDLLPPATFEIGGGVYLKGFTLYQMLLASAKSRNLLELKLDLLNLKHTGILFFTEDILLLNPEERFEVYHSESPGKMAFRNAFPIEKHEFVNSKYNSNNYAAFLKDKYFDYYEEEVSEESIKLFQNCYMGQEYVWIYKDNR